MKLKTFFKSMLILGIVFGLFFGMGAGATSLIKNAGADKEKPGKSAGKEKWVEQDGERTNILVLGVDKRPGETQSRSDTMMLVSIDPKLDKAAVISIPRDTKVNVPGSPLPKICTANWVGGPDNAVDVVEDFMNIDIDYYIEMDFNGFKDIIDTLGGVTINVPHRMYKPSEGIDLKPGLQRLNGHDALAFVRFRGYVNGDIDRTQMQQAFIKALADEVLQAKTITKLPGLVKQANKYVETDMGLTDMLKVVSWAPGFSADSVITQTLPGYFYDEYNDDGVMTASYWVADKKAMDGIVNKLFAGETIATVEMPPYPVNVPKPKKDKDNGDNGTVKVGERESSDRNQERANLPSPGHSGELDGGSVTVDAAGPEGYI